MNLETSVSILVQVTSNTPATMAPKDMQHLLQALQVAQTWLEEQSSDSSTAQPEALQVGDILDEAVAI